MTTLTPLTTAEAAERLRCTPSTVRHMAREGRLEASYVGRQWLIAPEAVERHLAEHSNREKRSTRRRRRRVA